MGRFADIENTKGWTQFYNDWLATDCKKMAGDKGSDPYPTSTLFTIGGTREGKLELEAAKKNAGAGKTVKGTIGIGGASMQISIPDSVFGNKEVPGCPTLVKHSASSPGDFLGCKGATNDCGAGECTDFCKKGAGVTYWSFLAQSQAGAPPTMHIVGGLGETGAKVAACAPFIAATTCVKKLEAIVNLIESDGMFAKFKTWLTGVDNTAWDTFLSTNMAMISQFLGSMGRGGAFGEAVSGAQGNRKAPFSADDPLSLKSLEKDKNGHVIGVDVLGLLSDHAKQMVKAKSLEKDDAPADLDALYADIFPKLVGDNAGLMGQVTYASALCKSIFGTTGCIKVLTGAAGGLKGEPISGYCAVEMDKCGLTGSSSTLADLADLERDLVELGASGN